LRSTGTKKMTPLSRQCWPRRLRVRLLLPVLAGCLWIGPNPGLAQPGSRTADIGELVSVLLRKHPYLFDEKARDRLEAAYREYRLTAAAEREREKTGRGGVEAEGAQRPSWPARFALAHFLDTCPGLIRLDLREGYPETPPREPIELPGSTGALLLQLVNGREETRYFLQDYSHSSLPEVEPIRIESAPRSTTWVLLSLSGIPSRPTSLVLKLQREGEEPIRLSLEVKAPAPARLKVSVLSDDTGRETPSMVRLVRKLNGRDYRPGNALDLAEQFEGHGSGHLSTNLPGRLRGDYWCVPGPFEMSLPPGELEIAIRRGLEHLPLILDLGFKLTAAAWSDVPFAGTVGEVRMYAYAPEAGGGDAWFEAVGRGRTFVTNGPMLELEVGGAMPGDELPVKRGQKVRVRARAWGHPGRSRPSGLEIVRHGQVIRRIRPSHPGEHELRLSFELEGDNGYWIAARAEGSDGSQAHTTPVYVVRKPLRFWNHEKVERLITTRLHSLDEVERLVARARSAHEDEVADEPKGENERAAWWETRRLAEQGPELLDRVAEARRIYRQLRLVWKREASQREGNL